MTLKQSAGILPFKRTKKGLVFFLVHPGGPFWAKKDLGAWSIPKGEFDFEDKLTAAKREFEEETALSVKALPSNKFLELQKQTLKSGKTVFAFALEIDIEPSKIKSNTFKIGSREFPEIDKGEWFDSSTALAKINQGQRGFILELTKRLQS